MPDNKQITPVLRLEFSLDYFVATIQLSLNNARLCLVNWAGGGGDENATIERNVECVTTLR